MPCPALLYFAWRLLSLYSRTAQAAEGQAAHAPNGLPEHAVDAKAQDGGQYAATAHQATRTLVWQIQQRVDGFAVASHFVVQLHAVGTGLAHGGDLLAFGNRVALFHHQAAVVGVNR